MRHRYLAVAAAILVTAFAAVVILRFGTMARPARAHGRIATQPAAPALATGSCATSPWSTVATPTTSGGVLRATAAISHSDVWAVGYDYNAATQGNQALIEHWNGSQWSVVPITDMSSINGLAAISTHDVWAVGVGASGGAAEHYATLARGGAAGSIRRSGPGGAIACQ